MAEFRIELDGLELSDDQAERISLGIQQTILAELAEQDFQGDLFAVIRDPEWLGIWVRQLDRESIARIDPGIVDRFGRKF